MQAWLSEDVGRQLPIPDLKGRRSFVEWVLLTIHRRLWVHRQAVSSANKRPCPCYKGYMINQGYPGLVWAFWLKGGSRMSGSLPEWSMSYQCPSVSLCLPQQAIYLTSSGQSDWPWGLWWPLICKKDIESSRKKLPDSFTDFLYSSYNHSLTFHKSKGNHGCSLVSNRVQFSSHRRLDFRGCG